MRYVASCWPMLGRSTGWSPHPCPAIARYATLPGMTLGENATTPGGHPVPVARTFNPKRKALFLVALAKTGTITGAAARVAIAPATVYEHAKNDMTFADAISRARGDWEQALVEGIAEAGAIGKVIERRNGTTITEPGDWHAMAWLLEHAPATRERYAGIMKSKVEISGDPDGVPIQTENANVNIEIGPDTMDRLARVVEVLIKAGKLRLPDPNEIEGMATEVTPDE